MELLRLLSEGQGLFLLGILVLQVVQAVELRHLRWRLDRVERIIERKEPEPCSN